MTITSPHNDKLKAIRKLTQRRRERERAGRFVAEGEDLLAAADAAGWRPVHRLAAAGSGLEGDQVTPEVLASVSGLGSGTRALAVYEERWAPAPAGPLCLALYGVGDPGNVGAVLRSAQAFGAASVVLGPGCADPFGPKAVRASMGAVFTVALAHAPAQPSLLPGRTVALVAGEGPALAELGLHASDLAPVTLLIGAERDGLPAEVQAAADVTAQIPIASHSLNAAMAATVALYEMSRMPATP
ncbi:MAG TPA: RNA methyltransferase [Solirubrobacteraceae bacterium]|nr:RNA methyltransferase [Solirubrobacteraceae bacterium]